MKNLILLTFSIVFCFHSMAASNNFCDSAYDNKISRIESKAFTRAVGSFATSGAIGYVVLVSGIGLPALAFGAAGGAAGFVTTLMGSTLALPYLIDDSFLSNRFLPSINLNRERGLRAAMEMFKIQDQSKEDLKADAFIKYQEHNPDALYEDFVHVTLMDIMLKKVNKKRQRKGKGIYSYEDLRVKLTELGKTDAFCPMISGKHRPRTILQIKKIIDKLD